MARQTPACAPSALVVATLAGAVGLAAAACHGSTSVGKANAPDSHPLVPEHQPCDITSKSAEKVDGNNDGRPDIVTVRSGNREVCRAEDLNLDGVMDRYVYFDDAGRVRRIESDYDRDGRIDEIATYSGGVVIRKDREMNLDGKLDTWEVYKNGLIATRERDTIGDGRVHQWWSFPDPTKPDCAIVITDGDGNGRQDPSTRVDLCHPNDEPPSLIATASASANFLPPAASGGVFMGSGSTTPPSASAPPAASSSAARGSVSGGNGASAGSRATQPTRGGAAGGASR